jgi:hypothetical protein
MFSTSYTLPEPMLKSCFSCTLEELSGTNKLHDSSSNVDSIKLNHSGLSLITLKKYYF